MNSIILPFIILSRDRKTFVVGRSDTKEVLCIGSFNKFFADEFDEGDFVFLQINSDGTAEEIHHPKKMNNPSDYIRFDKDKVIVAAKIGSYWITPSGFDDWAKNVFK